MTAETTTRTISITDAEGHFVGSGTISAEGRIECAAILGGDQDAAERIYDAIEDAIAAGVTSGATDGYEWEVSDPLAAVVAASDRLVIRWTSPRDSGIIVATDYGSETGWLLSGQPASDRKAADAIALDLRTGRGRGDAGHCQSIAWEVLPGVRAVTLWVEDQVMDHDETTTYLEAATRRGVAMPQGVTLDANACLLAGSDADLIWTAFVALRDAVAAVGHGEDMDGAPIPGRPSLIAHQGRREYPIERAADIAADERD